MTRTPEARAAAIARNRAYLAEVRANTFCELCGAQPIDFHSDTHHHARHRRINQRVLAGQTIASLQAEIARCHAY
jgi:cytochrome P450